MNALIAAAVFPQKDEAVSRVVGQFSVMVDKALARLADAGNDLNVLYPMPKSVWDASYKETKAKRGFIESITTFDPNRPTRRLSDPNIRLADADRVARFLDGIRKAAEVDFDQYVAKLSKKVGDDVADAKIVGYVWNHSILTITKADGSTENWHTQQIVNVSKLGKLFNQWPTRKMK